MTEQKLRNISEWLASCQTRFKNMYVAELDMNGYPALTKALENYNTKGYFTVGEIQYLFNRSHPKGAIPRYNRHRGYDKIHGNLLPCPLADIIDCNVVNWRTGSNGVIQEHLMDAIKAETNWEFRIGNLRPKHMTTYSDLFR